MKLNASSIDWFLWSGGQNAGRNDGVFYLNPWFFNILAGVALILFGARFLRKGFDRLFGHGLVFLLQSSTATIGLGIALTKGGVGDLGFLVAIVLGANVGVACTALLAGWGSIEGRRLGGANLLLKGGMALGFFFMLAPFLDWWGATPGGVPRQAANFHTAFNLMVALAGLPLVNALYLVVGRWMFPSPPTAPCPGETEFRTDSFLDEAALESPSMALANATRQTLAMADEVKGMLEDLWPALQKGDVSLALQVKARDDKVDRMNNDIKSYLSRLSEESMGGRDSRLQLALFSFTSELEAIGDVIDRNLCHQVVKHGDLMARLSGTDRAHLEEYYGMVLRRFQLAVAVLTSRRKELAKRLIDDKDEAKEKFLDHRRNHYAELSGRHEVQNLEASSYYLDLLNSLRRISSHLTSIGYHFARDRKSPAPADTAESF